MKYKYQIGDWVSVSATVGFGVAKMKRKLFRTKCNPFNAQIVGATRKQLGIYHIDGDEGPCRLERTGSVLVWKVIRGVLNTPILVFPGDLKLIVCDERLPWLYSKDIYWSKSDREMMRDFANEIPRCKGRFIKEAKT